MRAPCIVFARAFSRLHPEHDPSLNVPGVVGRFAAWMFLLQSAHLCLGSDRGPKYEIMFESGLWKERSLQKGGLEGFA